MPKHLVIFQPSGRRGYVESGTLLRTAARDLGVEIESICAENATCGKCKIIVEEGDFQRYGIISRQSALSPLSEAEANFFARRPNMLASHGWTPGQVRLSCQARVLGDLLIHVPEESRGNRQIVRKTLHARPVDVQPAIRNYYLPLPPPTLEDARGDWERLADGLARAMQTVDAPSPTPPAPGDLFPAPGILPTLGAQLREAGWQVTASVWRGKEVVRIQPGLAERGYGAAIDVGTTTLALYLCDLASGEILSSETDMNPQIVYGEDVMARIQYTLTEPGGLATLQKAIVGALNALLARACQSAAISTDDVLDLTLVGNSAMHHILLGLSPAGLGRAPYVPLIMRPLDLYAREIGIQAAPGARLHVLPLQASFVGADTSGMLLAEAPHLQEENWLLIDIGTNAELVLGNRHGLMCTSTPTGPALEGAHIEYGMRAAPGALERVEIDPATLEARYKLIGEESWNTGRAKGICGSAILDAVAELYRVGIIDHTGKFNRSLAHPRLREGEDGMEYVLAWANETSIGRDIPVTAHDVRQIQLAKAALFVAAQTLLRAAGLTLPDKIVLAGGFGAYIDVQKAMHIGLMPHMPLEKVVAVGNAAGEGARIALLNVEKRAEAANLSIQRIELPTDPNFQREYIKAIHFPKF
jgi:uncharacterized 2Fe-2S/4Fe-4S cluster protein (DUF4445 family)